MAIKDTQQLASPGWNPAWGDPPITKKIHLGIVVYQRWRYETWGMDLKFLTLLKRVRLVWSERFFWPLIIFPSAKKDYDLMAYLEEKLGTLHILSTALAHTGADSSGGEKCSIEE